MNYFMPIAQPMLFSGTFKPLYPGNPHRFPVEYLNSLDDESFDIAHTVWERYPNLHEAGINGTADWIRLSELCVAAESHRRLQLTF
jgi:hypothetical protein